MVRTYDSTLANARRKTQGVRHRFSPPFISPLRTVTTSRGRNAFSENRVAPRVFRSLHQVRTILPALRSKGERNFIGQVETARPRTGSECGGGAGGRTRGAKGSSIASVISLVETCYAEGNVLSRLVDLRVASVTIPGATVWASLRLRRHTMPHSGYFTTTNTA